ncbi:hypothetical protein AB0G06_43520 [Nonomuraea dietziae]|uniref:hypothetical protein n=1 Tax=Nonomuraea dietziae TaxID=65515 RepID=UPI0033C1F9C8
MEVLAHAATGVRVIRQRYADGYIYEYQLPKGRLLDPSEVPYSMPFLAARLMRSFDEDRYSYISVWVPAEECAGFELWFRRAASKQEFTYLTSDESQGELEMLICDSHLCVARVRHHDGWMYSMKLELGHPTPSFSMTPTLAPLRMAPIVSVERDENSFTTTYWVADNAPYAPTAA